MNKQVKEGVWEEYAKIKEKEYTERSEHEEEFFNDFMSWNSGDCSDIGLIRIFTKYLISTELDESSSEPEAWTSWGKKELNVTLDALNNLRHQ